MSTAKTVEGAIVKMESAATDLLRRARGITADCAWYEQRDFLTAAREYARSVNRVTRVRSLK